MLKQRLITLAASVGLSAAVALTATYVGQREGVSLTPYQDEGGTTTWCYGQTNGAPKIQYTLRECDLDLLAMAEEYRASVAVYLPKSAPTSVQAAFTDMAVNLGKSGWRGSDIRGVWFPAPYMAALAKEDWKAACAGIEAPWKGKLGIAKGYKATIQGKPSRGLENRRKATAELCRGGL